VRGMSWLQFVAGSGGLAALATMGRTSWPVCLVGGAVFLVVRYLRHREVLEALRIGQDAVARSDPSRIPEVMDSVGAVVGSSDRDPSSGTTGHTEDNVDIKTRRRGKRH
jgi:hypothetical protein